MSPSRKSLKSRAGQLFSCFTAAREGMVATEFALIAPVMILVFFAVTELSDVLEAGTKVTSVASIAADLVGQEKQVCDAEMNDVFAALNEIIFPYPANNMGIRISSLIDNGNNTVKVAWSDAQNMAPRAVNAAVGIPAGLVTAGGSVIFAEVSYTYNTGTGNFVTGTPTLSDVFYIAPRRVAQIARTANNC